MSSASGHQSRFLCPRAPCATGHFAAPLFAAAAAVSVVSFAICLSFPSKLESLARSAPGRAFGAQSAENQFAFTKHPPAERGGGRPGHFVPVKILDIAAAVADEVVMPHSFHIKPRRASLHRHFTHQTGLY